MKINIKHIAMLANIPLTLEEEKNLENALETTLEHVGRLSKIDTSEVKGTNEVTHLENVWREDIVTPSLTQKEALMNAKHTYYGFFVVPVVLKEAIE